MRWGRPSSKTPPARPEGPQGLESKGRTDSLGPCRLSALNFTYKMNMNQCDCTHTNNCHINKPWRWTAAKSWLQWLHRSDGNPQNTAGKEQAARPLPCTSHLKGVEQIDFLGESVPSFANGSKCNTQENHRNGPKLPKPKKWKGNWSQKDRMAVFLRPRPPRVRSSASKVGTLVENQYLKVDEVEGKGYNMLYTII